MQDSASERFYTILSATGVGDFVTYSLPIGVGGTYNVKVVAKKRLDKGIFQLSIDGTNQGAPQDEYGPVSTFEIHDLGLHTFSVSSDSAFQFLITGRNTSSSGYSIGFDYIDLNLVH